MAGKVGDDPRVWLAVQETAAAFLSRSLSSRPPIILPPPLHRAPLRPGNVVEIAGPSNSGKSHLLLMATIVSDIGDAETQWAFQNREHAAAVQCILPKEWEGIYFGGLGKAVMYLDLDCRFDVLRLAQILRNRVAESCSSAHLRSGDLENDGTKDELQRSFENTVFSDCMQRFLYTLHSRSRSEMLGVCIYFVMIDSIGAFYWIDRGSQPVRENKGKSLQGITETVVQEIRKFLQLQPALVLVTKTPIYGEGTTTANDFSRGSSKYMLDDPTVLRHSRNEEERTLSSREYMPSIWQSLVTHRINLQVQEAEYPSLLESEVLCTHTSEWVQPSLKTKEKFSIVDGGVVLVQ
ncbi:hypothetical protein U9M48_017009 [Paspalum notatum var. saurae]|uniref:RecA family profile 1 domain-containing protein n=1 Tax=Paspalum notatum var. saurae TaxID=547442 RepID=A0AAQ3T8V1_PASNO